ncbi:MAG: type I-E CRISPR-associated protein Cas5/CasD [Gulosibacter sp.]|uniref:type I-E CRISPR-associated protein Cas5/CasD n=1 Tax=Gulosibacter sp. TaxID=2817531 RepID=UPI003F8DDF4E
MATLVLEFAGPLQAWGSESRFFRRETSMFPTKSGVIGMIAAAEGRRRTDSVEDLVSIRFGVRQEQQGSLLRDFQTAVDWRTRKAHPLSQRYFVADARYLVFLEADKSLLQGLGEAISSPVFPLYLGRRSCPPAGRLVRGIEDGSLESVLETQPWRASDWYRKKQSRHVSLLWSRDAAPGERHDESVRDLPKSFDPRHRDYGLRDVVHGWTSVENKDGRKPSAHDALELLGGES